MTAGWVAATTRGRALLARSIGPDGARALIDTGSWPDARAQLGTTVYGVELLPESDRAAARRTAAVATAWQLRVLAGWLPPAATGLARLFAGPMEIANIERHLEHLAGAAPSDAVGLGSLAVAWPRVARATSPDQVRAVLARSVWGDPGGADRVAVSVGLRVAWARRIAHQVPAAGEWARGAIAVLIAREVFVFGRDIQPTTGREIDKLIGTRWRRASTIADLAEQLPKAAAWAVAPVASPSELWQAEVTVVHRVVAEATQLAASGRYTQSAVMAVMALLLVDLWRVSAAIELVGRGPSEVFDDVA